MSESCALARDKGVGGGQSGEHGMERISSTLKEGGFQGVKRGQTERTSLREVG